MRLIEFKRRSIYGPRINHEIIEEYIKRLHRWFKGLISRIIRSKMNCEKNTNMMGWTRLEKRGFNETNSVRSNCIRLLNKSCLKWEYYKKIDGLNFIIRHKIERFNRKQKIITTNCLRGMIFKGTLKRKKIKSILTYHIFIWKPNNNNKLTCMHNF